MDIFGIIGIWWLLEFFEALVHKDFHKVAAWRDLYGIDGVDLDIEVTEE